MNRLGVRRTAIYVVLGLGLWVAFLKSGVHATIAGVLLALTVPARRKIDASGFRERAQELIGLFAQDVQPGQSEPTADQRDAVHALEESCEHIETPLARMEHALHGWVAFGIMPVFALANAGVAFGSDVWSAFGASVTLGVLFGLLVGKQVGVLFFSWLAVRMGWAVMPPGITWRHIYGVSCLTGIGFTMALFIANLAFLDAAVLDQAKIGIFAASLLAGLAGWLVLRTTPVPGHDGTSG